MDVPALLLEVGGSHGVEVAETLIAMAEFLVIFVAARAMAELMVRIQLPTILGELVAGVLIGVSGLHLIVPPETHAQLNSAALGLLASLADITPSQVQDIYLEGFSSLQAVSQIGLFALLFLTGLESELDELVAVGLQATTVALTGVVLPFALGTFGLFLALWGYLGCFWALLGTFISEISGRTDLKAGRSQRGAKLLQFLFFSLFLSLIFEASEAISDPLSFVFVGKKIGGKMLVDLCDDDDDDEDDDDDDDDDVNDGTET